MKVRLLVQSASLGFFFCLYACAAPVLAVQDLPATSVPVSKGLSTISCGIKKDGLEHRPLIHLSINQQGQTMISLQDTVQLFSCHLEFQPNGTLSLHRLDTNLTFRPDQYFVTQSFEQLTPLQRLDNIYIPLRIVGEGFNYVVEYQKSGPFICLNTPEYMKAMQEEQETARLTAEDNIPPAPSDLPVWGSLSSELALRWPQEKIIGAYYTTLINSPEGRTNNIILSCERINGTVLADDAVFSFNQVVGERTIAAGYQEAKIFVGKTIQSGLGGGICQASTTLYNAGLETDLQIVERYQHTLPVSYIGPKRDATVSWGGADLKMRNCLGRPVKILCCVYGPYVMAAFAEVDNP